MLVRNLASPILNSASVNPDTDNKKRQIFGFIGSPKSKKKKNSYATQSMMNIYQMLANAMTTLKS